MFELFPAEPHLKHSIRSLKVEQHIIHATFYRRPGGNFVFCERKDLQEKRISISEDLKFETGSFICQSVKSIILNNRDEKTFLLVANHSNRCYSPVLGGLFTSDSPFTSILAAKYYNRFWQNGLSTENTQTINIQEVCFATSTLRKVM